MQPGPLSEAFVPIVEKRALSSAVAMGQDSRAAHPPAAHCIRTKHDGEVVTGHESQSPAT